MKSATAHNPKHAVARPTWVLVADRSRARLFELSAAPGSAPDLLEIDDFVNPDGRGSERGQVSERRPRVHESIGATRHAIEPHTSLQDKAADRFAHELGERLEQGRTTQRYERLVLIALPRFLGMLHGRLSAQVRACIVAEIPHELSTRNAQQIKAYLPEQLLSNG